MKSLSKIEKTVIVVTLIFALVIIVFNLYDITVDKNKEYTHQQIESNSVDKVNINTADIEALCTLSGVGETTAQNIIEYREQNGGFKNVEQILEVDGIGEQDYIKISPLITVE